MTNENFVKLCLSSVLALRDAAPIRTGNLRYNAIRIEFIDANTCKIYVDEEIAPYMPYTNEPWVSPKWNGKQNPNEGWFDFGAEWVRDTICKELGSLVEKVKHDNS